MLLFGEALGFDGIDAGDGADAFAYGEAVAGKDGGEAYTDLVESLNDALCVRADFVFEPDGTKVDAVLHDMDA